METFENWKARKQAQTRAINRESGSDIGIEWGTILGRTRDSGTLETSNWNVITQDMIDRFPDDCRIHRFRHWAVGWIEELFIRLDSPAGLAGAEWERKLENYPIASEEDLSELELEEEEEGWKAWGRLELAEAIGKRFEPVDLDLLDAFLDSIRDLGCELASVEHDDDGPIFPIDDWAELATRDDVEAYGSEEDWAEYDRLADLELPPYKRDSSMPEGWGRD